MSPSSQSDHESGEEAFRVDGFFRRNAGILSLLGVSILLAPVIERFLSEYRGVLIELQDDRGLIAFEKKVPKWLDVPKPAQLGQMLDKRRGEWNSSFESPTEADKNTLALYHRYIETYRAEIIDIRAPSVPGGAFVAVIRKEDGREDEFEVWAKHLADAEKGRWLKKEKFSWDPYLEEITQEPTTP